MSASDTALSTHGRVRIGFGAAVLLVGAFVVWLAAYANGSVPWLGYAWATRTSHGAGPIGIIGETNAGTSFGIDTFIFLKGQEIVIDYDAEITAGSLWFHVFRPFDATLGDGAYHYVTASGKGAWATRIPETGLYTINIEPSAARGAGRGYDMRYTVWWGARPGR
jgi:hypothetical protein